MHVCSGPGFRFNKVTRFLGLISVCNLRRCKTSVLLKYLYVEVCSCVCECVLLRQPEPHVHVREVLAHNSCVAHRRCEAWPYKAAHAGLINRIFNLKVSLAGHRLLQPKMVINKLASCVYVHQSYDETIEMFIRHMLKCTFAGVGSKCKKKHLVRSVLQK